MITVKTPDGGVAQFPDGTDPNVIKQALAKKFAPEKALAPNMLAAKRAREGTLEVSPDAARKQAAFDQSHIGPLEDSMKTGRLDALGRGALQGLTFGFGDEAVAAIRPYLHEGETYDSALKDQRDALAQARQDRPGYAYGGEIAGAMAVPMGTLGQGGGLGARVVGSAATGAGQGALYGFGAGEGGFDERARSALVSGGIGGAVGAALPALGAGIQKIGDKLATRKEIARLVANAPSTDELKAAGSAAYKAVDDAGVTINPSGMRSTADDILGSMRNSGLDETGGALSLTPKSARVAQLVDEAAQTNQPIPFSAVDQLRRKAGVAAGDVMNKAEQALGMKAITGLDDMVKGLTPEQVASGNPEELVKNIGLARDIWAKMSRSQLIDDAIGAGETYVSGSGSGIRNKFASILRNPKLRRGFSEPELEAIRKVANGSIPAKMLQMAAGGIGNIATMGGGVGLGASLGGIPGAILGGAAGTAVAGGLRKASDALTMKNAEVVRALIASGGLQKAVKANPQIATIAEQLVRRGLLPAYPSFARSMLAPSSP